MTRLPSWPVRTFVALAVLVVCAGAGYLFGTLISPVSHDRMFPWIVARAAGTGALIDLGLMSALGLWFRRPARSIRGAHRETLLRVHVALGPALAGLIAAHVWALLADHYSGVTAAALVVPDASRYRPVASSLGMVAAWMVLAVMLTAALAGRRPVGRRWAPVHKLAYPAFALVWVHGVLAGSDTPALRWLYIALALAVGAAAVPLLRRRARSTPSGPVPA